MVAANEWRDYAIDHLSDRAVFSVFRRSREHPLYQIVKSPKLARKQGAFSVVAAGGLILKRGHELAQVLRVFDKTLRLVKAWIISAVTWIAEMSRLLVFTQFRAQSRYALLLELLWRRIRFRLDPIW